MDKNSYALGMSIAHNMLSSGVKDIVVEDFVAGLTALLQGREPEITFDEAAQLLDKYFAEVEAKKNEEMAAQGAVAMEAGHKFLAENSLKEGVKVTETGLQYKVVSEGSGKKPGVSSKVKCHYEGRFIDGGVFDSSYRRNEPAVFGVNQVIPGWTEALQLMAEGSKWELYIPYNLAYGEMGAPGAIPPYSTLIFTVELLEVL
ncbi:MAG: FKBP-type peptidyl-prolyl cis-trans isomerase [Bacteroidales bacterium]|nr:FKBP-type peptidyl-prolyl cis-trans isomerase [Bacteroidales bacterium]